MQCAETTHHMTHHMFQVGGFRWVVGVEPLAVGGTIANDRRSQNPEITTSPRPGPPCPQKCADGLPSGHTPLSLQGDHGRPSLRNLSGCQEVSDLRQRSDKRLAVRVGSHRARWLNGNERRNKWILDQEGKCKRDTIASGSCLCERGVGRLLR